MGPEKSGDLEDDREKVLLAKILAAPTKEEQLKILREDQLKSRSPEGSPESVRAQKAINEHMLCFTLEVLLASKNAEQNPDDCKQS